MISSPDPIERVLEPGDVKEGYFEVKEDVKCLMNVRAARMFPFCRDLEVGRLSGYFCSFWRMKQRHTGVYREERNDLDSFRQTNLPSSQPKPSRCPVSQPPKDEVRPRQTRPLMFRHSQTMG